MMHTCYQGLLLLEVLHHIFPCHIFTQAVQRRRFGFLTAEEESLILESYDISNLRGLSSDKLSRAWCGNKGYTIWPKMHSKH